MTESVITVDWENGFVEASAMKNENITKVCFLYILSQNVLLILIKFKDI